MNSALINRVMHVCVCSLLMGLWLSFPQAAIAKTIYKYTDENGIVHFTDRPPEDDIEVETRRVRVDTAAAIRMRTETVAGRRQQIIDNLMHGPVQIELRLTESDNVRTEPPLPHTFVLKRGFSGELVRYLPQRKDRSWRYQVTSRYVPGMPGVSADRNYRYLPPWPAGQQFIVSQGFHGKTTHNSPDAIYAVDFPMPVGTPIVASREGVVMEVHQDYYAAGQDRERFGARANAIRIHHADGSMAIYAHLDVESALVQPGDVVLAGETIARSGNTGFSSGPHLHFAIQVNAGMRLESIPFRFRQAGGKLVKPLTGTRITGVRP